MTSDLLPSLSCPVTVCVCVCVCVCWHSSGDRPFIILEVCLPVGVVEVHRMGGVILYRGGVVWSDDLDVVGLGVPCTGMQFTAVLLQGGQRTEL